MQTLTSGFNLSDINWHEVFRLPFGVHIAYEPHMAGQAALYLLIALAVWIGWALFKKIIRLLHDLRTPQVFIEITPPKVTTLSATSTTELFNLIAGLLNARSWRDRLSLYYPSFSFEIVSQKEAGIRYIVRVPVGTADLVEKTIRSYQPGIHIQHIDEYLPAEPIARVTSFRLTKLFTLPLKNHAHLSEHDPLAYLTGTMTQLKPDELMALQVVVRPFGSKRKVKKIKWLLRYDRFTNVDPEWHDDVRDKLNGPLFEATTRTFVTSSAAREKGLRSSFATYTHPSGQALKARVRWKALNTLHIWLFRQRLNVSPLILSSSEIASLYHFPHSTVSETEDLMRVKSRELPAPLPLKNNRSIDVVFGKNTFGNTTTLIGLTDDDRSRHVYLLGQTGSGKSTVMYHAARDDILKGRGLAVVDPHGDLAEDLLQTIPEERINDLIYFNPFDVKYPVGINLLELTAGLEEDELELEKELVCESVISIFRRVFNKDDDSDAHRIEYVLRNTIYTAFTIKDCTIFTVYDLLNDPDFRKRIVAKLSDHHLRHFWKNEFGKAGNYQIVKMVSGVTAKVGRFLFSPVVKRILEQPHSTINFDQILSDQKILLCNVAEGKIGEDTSRLLGTTIIAKIQQAAVRRVRKDQRDRTPFYLFIDEFQNFATSSFTKLLSGGRKFGLRITIAEQSTAQQSDSSVTNVILANTGTVICFRTASPVDEQLMLAQFSPAVEKGDIGNLPRYRFYMRLSAVEPSAPFSGETLPISAQRNEGHVSRLVESSRRNHAAPYEKPVEPISNISPQPAILPKKKPAIVKHSVG